MKPRFVICSNTEHVMSLYSDPVIEFWNDVIVDEACDSALCVIIKQCGEEVDIEFDSVFRNWNGGKYSDQKELYGWCGGPWVMCNSKDVLEIASEAQDAFLTTLEKSIEEYKQHEEALEAGEEE